MDRRGRRRSFDGSVATKSDTVGVPSAAARCTSPVSTPMTSSARARRAASAGSDRRGDGGTCASGTPAAKRSLRACSSSLPQGRMTGKPDRRERSRSGAASARRATACPPRRAVKEHDEGSIRHRARGRQRRHQAEPRRTFDPIAKRGAGELATTNDEMLGRVDRMMPSCRSEATGSRMLARSGPCRTPRAMRAISAPLICSWRSSTAA